jgi:hypothetical protein
MGKLQNFIQIDRYGGCILGRQQERPQNFITGHQQEIEYEASG